MSLTDGHLTLVGNAGHAFEEHTSEVQVRLWAPTQRELFAEAAIALAELMRGARVEKRPPANEPIVLDAENDEELLVDWLNELLYRTEMAGRLYEGVRVDEVADHRLRGAIGAAEESPHNAVKAATFHGLRVAPTASGYAATVILDV